MGVKDINYFILLNVGALALFFPKLVLFGIVCMNIFLVVSYSIVSKYISRTPMSTQKDTYSRANPIQPVRRPYHFLLEKTDPKSVVEWNPNGRFLSLLMAALSIFFPDGERMFCKAVEHHQNHPSIVANKKLQAACITFVQQEYLHGKEHDFYNEQIAKQLPVTRVLTALIYYIGNGVTRFFPIREALAITVSLEHWTAILANFLLDHKEYLGGEAADSRFAMIWKWHACEETEHKAVAFDCHEQIYGDSFSVRLRRNVLMLLTSAIFFTLVAVFFLTLVIADGSLFNFSEWKAITKRVALLVSEVAPEFCDFFRPKFHPWDHANSEKISQMADFEAKLKRFQLEEDELKKKDDQKAAH